MLGVFIAMGYYAALFLLVTPYMRWYGGGKIRELEVSRELYRRALMRFFWITTALLLLLAPVSIDWLWLGAAPMYVALLVTVLFQLLPAWKKHGYSPLVLWLWLVTVVVLGIALLGGLMRNVFFSFFPLR